VKGLKNRAKKGIYGFVAIKSAYYSKSRQSRERSPKAEAFLEDVECTAHYNDSLAITTTTTFKVNHEDAYDSNVDEAPHAAATFMANLTGTSTGKGISNDIDFHSEVKERSRKGQNQNKTGQKWEAWRSREMLKAVTVDRARKTEENKKK
nr:hypothetical protein [Tanacetum cinerariifolium]